MITNTNLWEFAGGCPTSFSSITKGSDESLDWFDVRTKKQDVNTTRYLRLIQKDYIKVYFLNNPFF